MLASYLALRDSGQSEVHDDTTDGSATRTGGASAVEAAGSGTTLYSCPLAEDCPALFTMQVILFTELSNFSVGLLQEFVFVF